MNINTSELQGAALDWAVCKAQGHKVGSIRHFLNCRRRGVYSHCDNWGVVGRIIEKECIEIKRGNPLYSQQGNEGEEYYGPHWISGNQHGPTAIIAALRCLVASKLGDTVDIPDEVISAG